MSKTIAIAVIALIIVFGGLLEFQLFSCAKNADKISVVFPDGTEKLMEQSEVIVETPATKTYEYKGPSYHNRVVTWDFAHVLGDSAMAAGASQKPAQIGIEKIPGINWEANSFSIEAGGGVGQTTTSANQISIPDRIITWLKDMAIWGIIGIAAFFLLPVIFPKIGPMLSGLKNFVVKILSFIPGVGTILYYTAAKTAMVATSAFKETVQGIQNSKDAIEQVDFPINTLPARTDSNIDGFTDNQKSMLQAMFSKYKEQLRPLINTELQKAHSPTTQTLVAETKSEQGTN